MTAARHSTVTEHRTTAQVLAIVVQRIKQFQTGSARLPLTRRFSSLRQALPGPGHELLAK